MVGLPAKRIVSRHAGLGETQHRRVHWPSAPTPDRLVIRPMYRHRLRSLSSVVRLLGLLHLLLLVLMLHHGRLGSNLAG